MSSKHGEATCIAMVDAEMSVSIMYMDLARPKTYSELIFLPIH